MKKNVFGLRGVAIFAALVLLVAGFSIPAFADYWVTYSGTGAKGPIRIGQDVEWATGDTKIVSEEVIGWYNENSSVFTVTEVTATGAELNKLDGFTGAYTDLNVIDITTLGTAQASKALSSDANLDTTTVRNFTATGTVQAEQLTSTDDITATDLVQGADVTATDDVTAGDDLTVVGAAAIGETLTVTGAVSTSNDVTVASEATGGNAGARNKIVGLPGLKLKSMGTMVNGTTETIAYIDATPTGEWAEVDAGTNVAITADTTYYRDVTNSVKIAFGATAVENDGVDGTITQDDLSGNGHVGFWLMTDKATASGDLDLTIDDTDGTDQAYVLPATAAGVWEWVELDVSGCDANCNTADGIQVLLTAQGAAAFGVATGETLNVYLDAMYKWDADNEEALGSAIVQDGVLSVAKVVVAQDQVNTPVDLAEYTDYFVHYESGVDFIVTVSDQSAAAGIALIATE